jgi:phytoene synthase
MTLDTTKKRYETFAELDTYLYGSAEIVGLIMCKLLNLPLESYPSAQKLGRAFQYINFIRDIGEDEQLGRVYFPQELLKNSTMPIVSKKMAETNPSVFNSFMRQELDRYITWQNEAEKGFAFIPKRYLIPIKTAAAMYRYTAWVIYNNPMVVYTKKIKPSSLRILKTIIYNMISL